MRIEPFDAAAAAEPPALAYAALVADARREVTPEGERLPAAYVLNRLRHRSADMRIGCWVAYDGDAMTGSVEVSWRERPDNRDRAWAHFDVPEAYATPALLDALGAACAAHCAAAGRPVLTMEAPAGSAAAAWLRDRGGRFGALDEHNVLRLRTADRAGLAALAATAPDGYELVRWDGAAPGDLIGPLAVLADSMNDAPRDDLTMEASVYSVARLRDWESGLLVRGHRLWTVAARHVATGELAAYTQLEIRPEWPRVVENQDTAVARAHRGHGLGLWVKAANLVRVLAELPEAACVETWNAASNEHMIRVNRRLGFVREHVVEQWELDAPSVAARETP